MPTYYWTSIILLQLNDGRNVCSKNDGLKMLLIVEKKAIEKHRNVHIIFTRWTLATCTILSFDKNERVRVSRVCSYSFSTQ